jgi:hypothetical protein
MIGSEATLKSHRPLLGSEKPDPGSGRIGLLHGHADLRGMKRHHFLTVGSAIGSTNWILLLAATCCRYELLPSIFRPFFHMC